jgi:RimJ/RimL family protein N-acetyltransferase
MATVEVEGEGAVIRTPRLVLSRLMPDMASALFDELNDWSVVSMLSEVPWPVKLKDVEDFLARQPDPDADTFAVIASGSPIGVVAVKKPGSGNPPRRMPRLGYWIGPRHWGRGLGTEAVGAVVGHAFRAYPGERIGAGVFSDNPASRRVLEKLGFTPAGAYRTHSRSRDGLVETVDMQLPHAAWAATLARP